MQWFEPIIIIVVVGFVLTVLIISIKNKIKSIKNVRKGGGCHCSGCSCCCGCETKKK